MEDYTSLFNQESENEEEEVKPVKKEKPTKKKPEKKEDEEEEVVPMASQVNCCFLDCQQIIQYTQ